MNLDSVIDDIIDLTKGDLDKMDEVLGGKKNEDNTSDK